MIGGSPLREDRDAEEEVGRGVDLVIGFLRTYSTVQYSMYVLYVLKSTFQLLSYLHNICIPTSSHVTDTAAHVCTVPRYVRYHQWALLQNAIDLTHSRSDHIL